MEIFLTERIDNRPKSLPKAEHIAVRNAVFQIVRRGSRKAELRVKPLQIDLRGDFDRHITISTRDEIERLPNQPSPETRLAMYWRGDDASDPCTAVSRVGTENAQAPGETSIGIPGQQMIGPRIPAVDVLVGALLLDNEHFASQAQQ